MGERKERRLRREAEAASEQNKLEQQAQTEAEEAQPEALAPVDAQPSEPEHDPRENAPRSRSEAEVQPPRRRRSRINLHAAIVLVVIALLMGVVLGYVLGRQAGRRAANALPAPTDVPLEDEQVQAEVQSAEDANAEALAALAGEELSTDGDSALLMGSEDLTGGSPDAAAADEVVAEYAGGALHAGEVLEEYNSRLAHYVFGGYSEEEVSQTLLREVMEDMIANRVLEAHAKELGVYELTADDEAQIRADAEQRYAEQLDTCRSLVRTPEMSDAEADAAAEAYLLESEGVTLESIEAGLRAGRWRDKLYEKLTAEVSIGSNEIVSAYNEALMDQKERFLADSAEYEAAQTGGEVIVYNLPGYRRVQLVGLTFDMPELADAFIESTDAQPEADAALVEEKANALLQALRAGGDMEELGRQYGGEVELGCVCEGSSLWTQELVNAAMALKAPGELSDIVRTEDGLYILRYVEDVPEGTVAMNEIYDAISAQTLELARDLAYEEKVNAWLEEAAPKYYPERMQ